MPTATPPGTGRPLASTTFSNRKPLRSASGRPRNCQRTSGISSVSLLITREMRRSLPLASRLARWVRRSWRLAAPPVPCIESSSRRRFVILQNRLRFLIVRVQGGRGTLHEQRSKGGGSGHLKERETIVGPHSIPLSFVEPSGADACRQ